MSDSTFSIPPVDAWTASSLLQKAIRRGEAHYAEAAASAFYKMRGNAIWRRLTLIVFEDIGISDPSLCILVTEFSSKASARRQIGSDFDAISFLVRKMSAAAKNRETDYLICGAKQAPFSEPVRAQIAALSLAERIVAAADAKASILHRAVASWMASGINGGGPSVLSTGDLSKLLTVLIGSSKPSFGDAVRYASMKRTSPLSSWLRSWVSL